MKNGQCKNCRWWEGSLGDFLGDCSACFESGLVHDRIESAQMESTYCLVKEKELFAKFSTSRFFGCILFEQRRD